MRTIKTLAVVCVIGASVAASIGVATAVPELGTSRFSAGMSGAREVPGPGDTGASGRAVITVDTTTGEICWELTARNVEGTVTAAHIHLGDRQTAGGVVQGLTPPTTGTSSGCATNPTLAEALVADPSNYYVNVHSSLFPAGAVRGQLAGPGN